MWSNYVFSIERNTLASTDEEKRLSTIRCLKDRDCGIYTGTTVKLYGDRDTGRLVDYTNQAESALAGFDMSDTGEF